MPIQTIVFGIILSSLYGIVFHLWKGGRPWRLLVFLLISWIGFWGGHFLGVKIGIVFLGVGSLNTGFATLMSLFALGLGYWLIFGRLEAAPAKKS